MNKAVVQLIFSFLMLFLFIYMAIEANSFKDLARLFPLYISIAAAFILFIDIIRQLIKIKDIKKKDELFHPNIKGALKYIFYLIIYIVLVYFVGLEIASAIYVFAFLYLVAKMKLLNTIITTVILVVSIIVFANAMDLYWPSSVFEILTIL